MSDNGTAVFGKRSTRRAKLADHMNRYWFVWFSVLYGAFVSLPWLAPSLMQIGAEGPGQIIYTVYSFFCHQLPERSFFLFGQKAMYSLAEIQFRWQQSVDPAILRQFTGDPLTGWKVAWSDRMVALYTSILLLAWLWWPLRKKIRPLPLYGFVLLALPMAIDGASHFISDLSGLNQGFRCTNAWLAGLTGNAFPGWFYFGDAPGSFNSWMRLITGSLFGLGVVWFLFPILDRAGSADRLLMNSRLDLMEKLQQATSVSSSEGSLPDSATSGTLHSKHV